MISRKSICLDNTEKDRLISILSTELSVLRTKANISQEDLANIIGVSRQTYGAIERGIRKMTWNTYLAIILFYDYNEITHNFLRNINVFPYELVNRINNNI